MLRFPRRWLPYGLGLLFFVGGAPVLAAETDELIATIRAVGPVGKGNAQAAAAWKGLAGKDADELPAILAGFDGANPLAANWLRLAVDTIAERTLAAGDKLPAAEIEKFILDTSHNPRARRMAYEWLERVDPTARQRLIPGMLNDPSIELRRDAVRVQMDKANELYKADKEAEAKAAYQVALAAAREKEQVDIIVRRLYQLGVAVDLPRHFGYVMHWHMIGPFDNTGKQGFDVAYPPEKSINLAAEHQGKNGPVRWQSLHTASTDGMFDINKIERHKGAANYLYHKFTSDKPQAVEIRLGTPNAWKVWVNGQLLFGRDEYHRGARMDQYVVPAQLKAGDNHVLVKLCQNEQDDDWAQRWQLQLRICDATGTPVLSTSRPATPAASADEKKEQAE